LISRWGPCYSRGMARRARCSGARYVYHVLNRAVGRATLFAKPADYAAFEKVLRQGWERSATRLLSYTIKDAPRKLKNVFFLTHGSRSAVDFLRADGTGVLPNRLLAHARAW
jgi:hypothetical protein